MNQSDHDREIRQRLENMERLLKKLVDAPERAGAVTCTGCKYLRDVNENSPACFRYPERVYNVSGGCGEWAPAPMPKS